VELQYSRAEPERLKDQHLSEAFCKDRLGERGNPKAGEKQEKERLQGAGREGVR